MDLEHARAVLLDHARHPRNQHQLAESALKGECRNPLCGDLVLVDVTIAHEHVVDCALKLQGCTICTASASLMSEMVKTRSVAEIQELRDAFQAAVAQTADQPWPDTLAPLAALAHLRVNPARIPCALIGWLALKDALSAKS